MMATPQYDKLRAERGLFKFALTGKELDVFIKERMAAYRQLAADFHLKVAQ
jgi:putative tricarboxylic transport membrane protein